jgi:hypothetical protein
MTAGMVRVTNPVTPGSADPRRWAVTLGANIDHENKDGQTALMICGRGLQSSTA